MKCYSDQTRGSDTWGPFCLPRRTSDIRGPRRGGITVCPQLSAKQASTSTLMVDILQSRCRITVCPPPKSQTPFNHHNDGRYSAVGTPRIRYLYVHPHHRSHDRHLLREIPSDFPPPISSANKHFISTRYSNLSPAWLPTQPCPCFTLSLTRVSPCFFPPILNAVRTFSDVFSTLDAVTVCSLAFAKPC